MSGQPSYTETIKLELQLADIQSQLTQRTAELQAAKREVDVWKEKAELRGKEACAQRAELERVRALIDKLDKMTPKRPCAITWEKGVEILNYVQDDLLVNYRQHRQGMEG